MRIIIGRLHTIPLKNKNEDHKLYTRRNLPISEYFSAQTKYIKEFMEFPTIEVFKNITSYLIKNSLYLLLHRKLWDQIVYDTSYDFRSVFIVVQRQEESVSPKTY